MTAAGFDGLDGFKKRVPYAREQAKAVDRREQLVGELITCICLIIFRCKAFRSSLYWLKMFD